jgi:hypothetical protein
MMLHVHKDRTDGEGALGFKTIRGLGGLKGKNYRGLAGVRGQNLLTTIEKQLTLGQIQKHELIISPIKKQDRSDNRSNHQNYTCD